MYYKKYLNSLASALAPVLLVSLIWSSVAIADDCNDNDNCIAVNSWQIGIAAGIGGRTNPLVGGDDIPLIILPDIAWYGNSLYFDNGEFGWQWSHESFSIETFVAPNTEKANFSFWHTSNIFIPAASIPYAAPISGDETENTIELNIDQIASRKWALDGGIRWQWYGENQQFSVALVHDITSVHRGAQAILNYHYRVPYQDWRFSVNPQLRWVSDKLTDYYYGIDANDTENLALFYTGQAGFQWGVAINATYLVDKHWHWLFRLQTLQLHTGMTDSPIVKRSSTQTAFIGIAYRF